VEASNGVATRLGEHERRLNGADRARAAIRDELGDIRVENGERKKTIENIEGDIKEMKDVMTWIRRGMWTAAAFLISSTLLLAGVLLAVLAK
jgi:chromosome segregation ATPase